MMKNSINNINRALKILKSEWSIADKSNNIENYRLAFPLKYAISWSEEAFKRIKDKKNIRLFQSDKMTTSTLKKIKQNTFKSPIQEKIQKYLS